jgi:curli biogenesis system outer membrane secretion channel CsgG
MKRFTICALISALATVGCATVSEAPDRVSAPVSSADLAHARSITQSASQPTLRRKIAVGRFSNATNYGRALLLPGERDPMATQVTDMLVRRLVDSGRFLVFERTDLDALSSERDIGGIDRAGLVGVDALVMGSLTEFGRRTEGQSGFLSSTMRQSVDARVEVRLVDVASGLAFYSGAGRGSASTEAGEVAGFGSRAGFDATLNDRAIAAAVDDLVNNIISQLEDRPWRTDLLEVRGSQVFISGGSRQGLSIGSRFAVVRQGETVTSRQTGMPIRLPGEHVAEIEIVSFFGNDEFSEGSVARVVSGSIDRSADLSVFEVVEVSQ